MNPLGRHPHRRDSTENTLLNSPRSLAGEYKDLDKHYSLPVEDSVYSFHMFLPGMVQENDDDDKHLAFRAAYAWLLIILNFVIQFGLLIIVGHFVFDETNAKYETVIRLVPSMEGHRANYMQHYGLTSESDNSDTCLEGNSICHTVGDIITCSPPSIKVLRDWNLLDINGDGYWSREEATNKEHVDKMSCKFKANVPALFEGILGSLQSEPWLLQGRMHPNITSGDAIPKPYFDWYLFEPMLCLYGDQDMCGNMFESGVFDEPIKSGVENEDKIYNLDTALDYCEDLLSSTCSNILPGTYHVWNLLSTQKCGAKEFEPIQYSSPDPDHPQEWNMLKVDFQTRKEYSRVSNSAAFMFFLWCLFVIFYCMMYKELMSIYRVLLWVIQMPPINNQRCATWHRWSVLLVTILRTALFVVLGAAGTVFLRGSIHYVSLIFDSVSLLFIIEVDEILYETLLRAKFKKEHQDCDDIVLWRGISEKRLVPIGSQISEGLTVCCLIALSVYSVVSYNFEILTRVSDALNCACLVEGSSCQESLDMAQYWQNYWTITYPYAKEAIDQMVASMKVFAPAPSPASFIQQHVSRNLLK